jgi:hypothetical protein
MPASPNSRKAIKLRRGNMKNILKVIGGIIVRAFKQFLAGFAAISAILPRYNHPGPRYSDTAFQQRAKGIRNPKDPIKKAAIERRRKTKRLSMLSKPKRRAVYYHNLRSPIKMYA